MSNLYLIPHWFFGYDIALELIFSMITLLVAVYAYKVYKISGQRESKLFSVSFLLISISYLVWSGINLFLVDELNETTKVLLIRELNVVSIIGVYSHILLFIAGLTTLVYMTLKVENVRTYILLLILTMASFLLAFNKALLLYILSSLLIVYIIIHYLNYYKEKHNNKTLIVLISFILLLIANIESNFAKDAYIHYVVSHILQLGAYSLILVSLIPILNYGKKKK